MRPARPGRAAGLLALPVVLGACSLKDLYIDMSYPPAAPPDPARLWSLGLSATLTPSLVVDYDAPAAVAACLDGIDRDALGRSFLAYGQCLAESTGEPEPEPADAGAAAPAAPRTPRARILDRCLDRLSFLDRAGSSPLRTRCEASRADQIRLASALAATAEAFHGYGLSLTGNRTFAGPHQAEIDRGLRAAVDLGVRLMRRDPGPEKRVGPSRAALPALALSGGSANGAFTAGYLHAMLTLRELAMEHLGRSGRQPERVGKLEASHRFGSLASTSVGTLIGLAVDLYFSGRAPTPAESAALGRCLHQKAGTPLPPRAIQRCALHMLEDDFVKNEWELLCHEDGLPTALLGILGKRRNALRFEPLRADILEPAFDAFQDLMLDNDLVRVAMSADLEQNVLLGLDERACRLKPDRAWQKRCLVSGVLASIVLPVFADPVDRVWSGLDVENGERGTWLDGGIRSGTPAARAMSLTRGKVLAISTNRAEGRTARGFEDGAEVMFRSISALAEQTRQWELAYAELDRDKRGRDRCSVATWLGHPEDVESCDPRAGKAASYPEPGLTGDLLPIFVPESIEPESLFAEGYTFDPWVTTGLFLWGEKSFLDNRARVLGFLGWTVLRDLDKPAAALAADPGRLAADPGYAAYQQAVKALGDDVECRIADYRAGAAAPGHAAWRAAHRDERRDLMKGCLRSCEDYRRPSPPEPSPPSCHEPMPRTDRCPRRGGP
jgi:hypothetical protein